jgi:uncharacterized protein YcbK (DUF882 family)
MSEVYWQLPPHGMISEHFNFVEAVCRHCGRVPSVAAVEHTAAWLERVRQEVFDGRAMHISSWCRCPVHNRRIGGASQSYHLRGWAVDMVVRGLSPRQVQAACRPHHGEGLLIGGLGRYKTWTHIDRGPVRTWAGP